MNNLKVMTNILIDKLQLKPVKNHRSKPEGELYNHLQVVHNISNIEVNNRKLLKGKEIDLYIPHLKLGIEYNGLHWHSYPFLEEKVARIKHKFKTDMCDEQDICLLHIWEDDWLYNEEGVKNLIDIHMNPNRINLHHSDLLLLKTKNKQKAYSVFNKYSIQRLNKYIKHEIFEVIHNNVNIAYVQIDSNKTIINIAIHNSLISINSIINLCKSAKYKKVHLDMSTGLHNKIKGKVIKKYSPKSRLVHSKRRKSFVTTGNRIWDSGYCTMKLV